MGVVSVLEGVFGVAAKLTTPSSTTKYPESEEDLDINLGPIRSKRKEAIQQLKNG